jgi:hypothetical protein
MPGFSCSDNLFACHLFQTDKTRIVYNTFKLPDRFHKLADCFFIPYFFRHNKTTTKGIEIALHSHSLFGSFCQKQVAIMVKERAFIKVSFKRTA